MPVETGYFGRSRRSVSYTHLDVYKRQYQAGANPVLDAALSLAPALDGWLRQDTDAPDTRRGAYEALAAIMANSAGAAS